jgi:NADPH:quinone reductase-like Zn-dependent oxidoreductase
MRAVALSNYCKPSEYQVATLPTPHISKPDELLIRVRAASVNPVDVKMASGLGKLVGKATYSSSSYPFIHIADCTASNSFPYKLGYDLAGVVAAVGTSVSNFKPGDEVYSRIPQTCRGSIAEYAISTASTTAMKPKSLSFSEAASIPLAAQTALQALYRGEEETKGGLKGKTVFIPGGLSGTGSFGVQLAKNIFGAGKVITTLSTGKIPMIKKLLGEGTPDQIVDYTKDNVVNAIGKDSVDFMFDTVGSTLATLPVMKKGSWIISISTVPSGKLMQKMEPDAPFFLKVLLDIANWFYTTLTGWKGVNYSYLHLEGNTADLDKLAKWVDEGKVKPVVGIQVRLEDIEGVRKGCQQIYDGKGGVGKLVIDID